jgi:formiminotetrahydrofolate cyclodeaminase
VRKVDIHEEPKVVRAMEELAELRDGAALQCGLTPLADAFDAGIARQGEIPLDSDDRRKARKRLLKNAARAKERTLASIVLQADPLVALLDGLPLSPQASTRSS